MAHFLINMWGIIIVPNCLTSNKLRILLNKRSLMVYSSQSSEQKAHWRFVFLNQGTNLLISKSRGPYFASCCIDPYLFFHFFPMHPQPNPFQIIECSAMFFFDVAQSYPSYSRDISHFDTFEIDPGVNLNYKVSTLLIAAQHKFINWFGLGIFINHKNFCSSCGHQDLSRFRW